MQSGSARLARDKSDGYRAPELREHLFVYGASSGPNGGSGRTGAAAGPDSTRSSRRPPRSTRPSGRAVC